MVLRIYGKYRVTAADFRRARTGENLLRPVDARNAPSRRKFGPGREPFKTPESGRAPLSSGPALRYSARGLEVDA